MWRRIAGILVDQEFGLLPYAPIYLLAPVGAALLWSARPRLARGLLLVIAVYVGLIVFPVTNAHSWEGGWNPAARFLTPIVPLLAVAAFAAAARVPRAALGGLVALQIAISAYAWQNPKILWNDSTGRAAACDAIGDRACAYLPSYARRPS
jgi:hypothetical protein